MIGCLDSNKAHSHDMISIRMLKLCGRSVCKPLKIIFENCLANGYFPEEWKKANVVPIHRRSDEKSIKNYLFLVKYSNAFYVIVFLCFCQKMI